VRSILNDNGILVSGIDGMFSRESELASPNPFVRQNVIDYIRRNLELGVDLEAAYFIIAPGAVGRPTKYDTMELQRSVETLLKVADEFLKTGIRGTIEPIQTSEVSICHTFEEAKTYIQALNHPGVRHVNGDVYHMLVEESHTGEAIINAGDMLNNLHLADSNRDALGKGSLDLDTIIMALYSIGHNTKENCYVTAEPLPRGKNVAQTFYEKHDPELLDSLVETTIRYFREREEKVINL
ncbi:MAG: sugar phosphate isomerase/epimerase, partial [Candidatus Atribacteria bacterium]|nr:sugar phosphate isomerase/epimerase [Candidatus Atribacteria bacterium]